MKSSLWDSDPRSTTAFRGSCTTNIAMGTVYTVHIVGCSILFNGQEALKQFSSNTQHYLMKGFIECLRALEQHQVCKECVIEEVTPYMPVEKPNNDDYCTQAVEKYRYFGLKNTTHTQHNGSHSWLLKLKPFLAT